MADQRIADLGHVVERIPRTVQKPDRRQNRTCRKLHECLCGRGLGWIGRQAADDHRLW